MAATRSSAERVAENQSRFRDSNERIGEAADRYGIRESLPFLCECADEECTTLVRMSREAYARLRSNPRRFVNARGHDAASGRHARVVEEHEDYLIVEKIGEAGEIAAELDTSGAARHDGDD